MTAHGAASASSRIDQPEAFEKRPARLAMSRQFLAAPTGNAVGYELSSDEVRLANYLDSHQVADTDGSLDPRVRKMVRDGTGVSSEPLGQRPSWAFERVDDLSSPEADDVCQRIPAPSGLAEKDEEEDAADEDPPSKFANYQETVMLRQSKPGPKRGLVSPLCDKEEPALRDDAGRRVRFQPRMRDGNATEVPPTLQAGGASVFTVGREPSDECGMFRDDAGTGSATPGGFTIRQDTEVVPKRGDFEAREDTEVLRMGTGGGFDVREDTEVLRIGGLGVQAASGVGGNTTEGFEIREDTEVLRPGNTLHTGTFSIREDTEVLGNITRNTGTAFGIREDTEVLNRTNNTGTGAFAIREDTEVLARGDNTATGDAFAIREDTEVLGRKDHTNTGVFSIREDTQVLEDSVFSRRGFATAGADDAFAIREDTEVLKGVGNTTTGVFSVREDTEVLGGEFAVREDTEVLNNIVMGQKAAGHARSGGLAESQPSGSSGALLGGDKFESMRVLGPAAPQGSADLALRAPSGHLRPINKSGSLQLADADGGAAAAVPLRTAQKVRESSARRRLQFGDDAALAASAAEPGTRGFLAPKGVSSCDLEIRAAQALLAGGSLEVPEDEDFTVLEAEGPQQEGAVGANGNSLLDTPKSQGRESFLDDSDTENAGSGAGSGAERLRAALATGSRGAGSGAAKHAQGGMGGERDMLGTLDDCPEHLLQYGDVDGDAHGPRSVPTSPARHSGAALLDRGGSSSLPGSPLKNRTALGSGRKPPLSPGKPLQGQSRRGKHVAGASGMSGSSRQFGDSTLKSAAATINPFLPEFTCSNISKIHPLSKFSGVHEIPPETLRAFVDALAAGHAATLPTAALEPGTTPLGAGGYATVYSATLSSACIAGAEGERIALKVATPAAAWEFAAARVITDRVPARYASLFLPARCIFLSSGWGTPSAGDSGPSKDAAPKKRCALGTLPTAAARGSNANTQRSLSVLAMPQGVDGTLLDLINAHKAADQPIPDALVMYVALQMLLILHAMQQARVIHTDLKPDNCLLSWPSAICTNAPARGRAPAWSAASASERGGHWGSGCLQAIDFGRAIDLQLLPVGTQFEGVSTTEGMQCPEMLSGKPWHYCHDAFCVAGTIHAVLLGKYITVQETPARASSSAAAQHKPVYRPKTSVPSSNPRKPLWDRLFRTLLNCPLAPERPDVTPLLAEFTSVRFSTLSLHTPSNEDIVLAP